MKRRTTIYLLIVMLMEISNMRCKTNNIGYPIVIGMPKAEVIKYYPFVSEERFLLTKPGQFSPAHEILRGSVRLMVAFDDDRVCRISPIDITFRFPNGIGFDSTFGDIKKRYDNYEIFCVFGYGRMVKVRDGIQFGFSWSEEQGIYDNEKVRWIELQRFP